MNTRSGLVMSLAIILIGFASLAPFSPVAAAWLIDRSGTLLEVDSDILGEESTSADSAGAPSRELLEKEKLRLEMAKKNLERSAETRQQTLELRKETRQSKIETRNNRIQIHQELLDSRGQVIRTTDTELEEGEPLIVEKEGEDLEINASDSASLEIKGQRVRTRTHFPLTIGPNNELIITKKDGTQKIVTVLPDAAAANLEQKGFVRTSQSVDLLETDGGTAVYQFQAVKEKRIFGIFRRKFKQSVEVSADSGLVVNTESAEESSVTQFLESLSL